MKKIGFLFAIVIMLVLFAVSASALEPTGQCGDNVYWNYNNTTKELVISGTGSMYDYDEKDSPFYRSELKKVVVKNGVTSVGKNAFCDCDNLLSVKLNDSVTIIGQSAFEYCNSLENVDMGKGVISIKGTAFYYCKKLANITIPDSVTEIEYAAFMSTAYYENVDNWENDVLYIGKYVIKANDSLSGDYTIKDGTLVIAEMAFAYCNNLNSITIPDSVVYVGEYGVYNCDALTQVTIGDGVTSIGDYAFHLCDNLSNISIGKSVVTIGYYPFGYSTNAITELTIAMKEIPNDWFDGWQNLKKVTLTEDVEIISDEAFYGCVSLESINFPKSLKRIGIRTMKNTAWYDSFDDGLIVFDNWIYEFKGDIPENSTVCIDSYIRGVACGALASKGKIVSLDIDNENERLTVENGVLFNKDKTILIAYPSGNEESSYIIPDSVKEIYGYAFYDCQNLKNIYIGGNISTIGEMAFYRSDSKNREVYVKDIKAWCNIDFASESANPMFHSYSKIYFDGILPTVIEIPNSITEIKAYAFSRCKSITNVLIHDGVTKIGRSAFYNCPNLESVFIGNGVTIIEYHGFADCYKLSSVTLGEKIELIGNAAFSSCRSLTEIVMHDNVTVVDKFAFSACTNLSNIILSNSINSIEYCAFAGCKKLEHIKIPKSVESIGEEAFYDCDLLKRIEILNSECKIYDSEKTINASTEIHGFAGSMVEDYAIKYSRAFVDITPHIHAYVSVVSKEATHLEEGTITYTCACGDTYDEPIAKFKEHTYEKEVTAPTCTKQGYTTFTCACGETYIGDYVNEKGHSYFSNTVQPTCTKSGTVTTFCTSCGDTKTETIEAIGHNFNGSKCTNCDYDKADECGCSCHKGGISGFFFKLILFFQKIFKTNKTCSCGVAHY